MKSVESFLSGGSCPRFQFIDAPAPARQRREPEPWTELRPMPFAANVQGVFRGDEYLGAVVWHERERSYHAVGVGYERVPGSYRTHDLAADAVVEAHDGH